MKTLILSLILASSAVAQAVSFDDIVLWAGTGQNRAAVVIDFNDGQSPRSYVWGYRWDGNATGENALRSIVQADPLLFAVIDQFSFGASLNSVSYIPMSGGGFQHSRAQDFGSGEVFWSYWTSTEGSAIWSFSNSGMSDRVLSDGAVDGWAFSNPGYNAIAPTSPVAAVPEPLSIIALGVGIAFLKRRRN